MFVLAGMPLVMLYNTGGVTQAFGSLQRILARGPNLDSNEMLKRCELVSKENWAASFGIPEIMMMKVRMYICIYVCIYIYIGIHIGSNSRVHMHALTGLIPAQL